MDTTIILSLLILSIIYIVRLYKMKFKYEKRREVKILQLVIFNISVIAVITGLWDLFLLVFILILALIFLPKKFRN